jgi:hypothetical protein
LDFYHEFFIYSIMLLVFPNVNASGALGTEAAANAAAAAAITAEQVGYGVRPKN